MVQCRASRATERKLRTPTVRHAVVLQRASSPTVKYINAPTLYRCGSLFSKWPDAAPFERFYEAFV